MATGALQNVLVCTASGPVQLPCSTGSIVVVQAYLIDPSQQQFFDSTVNQPFDYALATSSFAFAFVTVISLFFFARSSGSILDLLRRG